MSFQLIFKPLAQIEENPQLYACVESDVRRANFNRFPYSLFYVIDDDIINVLSCFHQHRRPKKLLDR